MSSTSTAPRASLLNGLVQVHGSREICDPISNMVRQQFKLGQNLYDTERVVRDYVIKTHGQSWYDMYREGVQFIIENEYINCERN